MTSAIYTLVVDSDRFATLRVVDNDDLDQFIDGFQARPLADRWTAPRVRLAPPETRGDGTAPDFVSLFGGVPVLSERAVGALENLLKGHGELLPLRCDDRKYWAFNVLSLVDLLDEDRSTVDWFAPGRLMELQHLVARRPGPTDLPPIFKLPQWRQGRVLLTQRFVDATKDPGLTGLDPKAVGEA